jgi:rsbT co-antagonist protein RsbR
MLHARGAGLESPAPMTVRFKRLEEIEHGLELAPVPAWVLDVDGAAICWANTAGLELWRADTREDLYSRDVMSGAPEKVTTRLNDAIAQARAGHVVRDNWTFYPRGIPTLVMLHMRGVLLPDGRFALLHFAIPVSGELPPEVQRTLNISRHTSFIVAYVNASGHILARNLAAMGAFGETPTWRVWFEQPSEADAMLAAALAGEVVRTRARVRSSAGLRWHQVDAQGIRDAVDGQLGVLVEHKDETERIEAEALAESRRQRIDEQRREILTLSAPILDVGEQTLAIPIIGRLHDALSVDIMAQLLHSISERRARHMILDVTGVVEIDEPSLVRLRQMLRSIRLLGVKTTITGIRPALARELIASGFDVEATTLRSLAEGLAHIGQGSQPERARGSSAK